MTQHTDKFLSLHEACAHFANATSLRELADTVCRAIVEAGLFREAVLVSADSNFVIINAGVFADEPRLDVLRGALMRWLGRPLQPFQFGYKTEFVRHSTSITRRSGGSDLGVDDSGAFEQLVTPLEGPDKRVFGYLSLCRPPSGLAPDESIIRLVEIVAAHAAVQLFTRSKSDEQHKLLEAAERRALERTQELRAHQERFTRLANAVGDIVIIADEQLNITYLNEAFTRELGFAREEILGRNLRRFLEEQVTDTGSMGTLQRMVDPSDQSVRQAVLGFRNKAGQSKSMQMRVAQAPGGRAIMLVARDASEQEMLMSHLLMHEMQAAGGRAAASIAHEINNPLQAVLTQIGALQSLQNLPDGAREPLERVRGAVDRIRVLARGLLTLSAPKARNLQRVSLNSIVQKTIELMRLQMQEARVAVDLTLDAQLGDILGDAGELQQLILNLVINAMEAMPTGGTIFILTKQQQDSVSLSIRDEGTGIPADLSDRIFKPFVTSKQNGSGLGLYICQGIAERHQAQIKLVMTGESGTVFQLIFPSAL